MGNFSQPPRYMIGRYRPHPMWSSDLDPEEMNEITHASETPVTLSYSGHDLDCFAKAGRVPRTPLMRNPRHPDWGDGPV